MSRGGYKARDKVALKNTRDGLVERNAATGEDIRVSKREADIDLNAEKAGRQTFSQSGKRPDIGASHENAGRHKQASGRSDPGAMGETPEISGKGHGSTYTLQAGNDKAGYITPTPPEKAGAHDARRSGAPARSKNNKQRQYSQNDGPQHPAEELHSLSDNSALRDAPAPAVPAPSSEPAQPAVERFGPATPETATDARPSQYGADSRVKYNANGHEPAAALQSKQDRRISSEGKTSVIAKHDGFAKPDKTADGKMPSATDSVTEIPVAAVQSKKTAKPANGHQGSRLNTGSHDKLRFVADEAAPQRKLKQRPGKTHSTKQGGSASDAGPLQRQTHRSKADAPAGDAVIETAKPGKLQFAPDEAPAGSIIKSRKLDKAQRQAERVTGKLERARGDLPTKRKLRRVSVIDEKSGAVSKKLKFEKTLKSQKQHLKGPLPLRPAKAVGRTALRGAHRKVYQVEHENVGIKAAHRAEMVVETGVRSALRHHKMAPYKKVAKLERAATKKSINLSYQKAIAQNPKLKSNFLTRAMQKRKIKKDYAKAAREAQKAAKRAKKTGAAVKDVGKSAANVVKRHPVAAGAVVLITLFIFCIVSLVGAFGGMNLGGMGGLASSTYLSEDDDITGADADYAALETQLAAKVGNTETDHPGYDEYRYFLDEIGHDPYTLASYLTVKYYDYTRQDVQEELAALFAQQYTLTLTPVTEKRHRIEYFPDGNGGVTPELVEYDYHILNVTLKNRSLGNVALENFTQEEAERHNVYMMSQGNRPELFEGNPYASRKEPLIYDVPPEALGDAVFAAMLSEAEKHLGLPYVWGGYSPTSGFDCSGFVSWVVNHSGWDLGRLGAKGLYNACTPVSPVDAKPGDLIFFWKTYDAPDPNAATHVGIYVGNGMMIHTGNPTSYASVTTQYWIDHFFGYGRLP